MMKDKVCIVTGASSGIGLRTSTKLLSAGASVLGVDIAAAPSSLAGSDKFKFYRCNLTLPESPDAVVKACQDAFGSRIDALLNIAGVMDTLGSVDTLRDDEWDRVIAVNLTAPVKLMRAVVPVMRAQGGGSSIANVSSKAGLSGAISGVAYTSSKHGLVGATKNVAWRYKDEKIRCNAICPGGVETPIMSSIDPTKMDMEAIKVSQSVYGSHKATDRVDVESVASLLIYLVSDTSIGMSGAIIPIDSAWSTI